MDPGCKDKLQVIDLLFYFDRTLVIPVGKHALLRFLKELALLINKCSYIMQEIKSKSI